MAFTITEDCISCAACEQECPNGAISQGDAHYTIDENLCTECAGYPDEPRCVAVCSVNGIMTHPERQESCPSIPSTASFP